MISVSVHPRRRAKIEGQSCPLMLIVDDDPFILRALGRNLSGRAEVMLCEKPAEALGLLDRFKVEVLLSDFDMSPSGLWLLEQARERAPKIRRILMSGNPSLDIDRYLSGGLIDAFLEKPIVEESLLRVLGFAEVQPGRSS